MKPILFHPAARAELDEAVGHYAAQRSGLGVELRAEVESAAVRIQQTPERWAPFTKFTRRFRVRRFPYSVVYVIRPELIVIVAVAHEKRKPGYWQARL